MRGPGILWMLQTAAGFSMAGPLFFLSLEYLRMGRFVGGVGFLLVGLFVLYLPTYLIDRFTGRISRLGGPRTWVRSRLGRRGTSETETDSGDVAERTEPADTDAGAETAAEADSTRGNASPLDRLRRR